MGSESAAACKPRRVGVMFFFSSRRRHTRLQGDWSSDVCSSDLIAAQTLGPEFKQWLNDPQKLLQLIAAAEGARNAGDSGMAPLGSVPFTHGSGGSPTGSTVGGTGALQEEEGVPAIRLLNPFGGAGRGESKNPTP